jgi:hypothetical protein
MLAPRTIPIHPLGLVDYRSDAFADPSPIVSSQDHHGAPQKFPHTRAQLSAIARQHGGENDVEDDTGSRVSSAFLSKIVTLLVEEHEDQLKSALKDSYPGMDDDTVSFVLHYVLALR